MPGRVWGQTKTCNIINNSHFLCTTETTLTFDGSLKAGDIHEIACSLKAGDIHEIACSLTAGYILDVRGNLCFMHEHITCVSPDLKDRSWERR